jgi:enoyl-CoA hydratase/carnithine racemase
MRRLEAILDELDRAADTTVIILTAAGRESFSAGGDIKYFATLDTREKGREMSLRMQRILDRLASGPRVVIAAINGRALGGGCEILTACHLRISSSSATFGFVQAANGVTTGWGGGARLFQLVGRSHALSLLLTAEPIDAREALRIGLVNRVVEPEELDREADALARRVSRNSPAALAAMLEMARLNCRVPPEVSQRETEIFADRWMSNEFRELLERFQ